jgi:hypothetical protein
VSVVPVPGTPQAFTFTMQPPAAAVPGRSASLEWVFGDGAKAVTGATTSHTYPTANTVIALVTVVDSAGARGNTLQVKIAGTVLRAKQKAGDLITGDLADPDTNTGIAGARVLAYRCATPKTAVTSCDRIGTTATRPNGHYRLGIPEVTKKGFVVVYQAGSATTSIAQPARFGSSRVVPVLPQPIVTLHVSKKAVTPGTIVRLTGKVQPGKKGKTVRLQGFIRGKWRSIGKATISQQGRYAASHRVAAAPGQKKLKVRAVVPGTAATLGASSVVKKIKILR